MFATLRPGMATHFLDCCQGSEIPHYALPARVREASRHPSDGVLRSGHVPAVVRLLPDRWPVRSPANDLESASWRGRGVRAAWAFDATYRPTTTAKAATTPVAAARYGGNDARPQHEACRSPTGLAGPL